jgi:TonB family protein
MTPGQDRRQNRNADLLQSNFTTRAQDSFRRAGGKRLLGATLGALLVVVLIILLGPKYDPRQDILATYGAPGELVIMPQVSIQEGRDRTHQLPKSLQQPPPPARMEIEKEETSPEGSVPVPEPIEAPPSEVITKVTSLNPDAEIASKDLVELTMPRQSNPDLYIIHQVHPEYPLDATPEDRRIPTVYVLVAVFVNPAGDVTDAMVVANTGSRVYADEVVSKVKDWKFGWRVPPGAGRWIQLPYNFNSPYFTGPQG